jgi:2-methylcitrate dehydratase PrpD
VRALRERIRVEHAPEFDARYPDQDSSEVVAELDDGTILRRRLDAPPGGPDNPMTPQEIRDKFESLAGRALPPSQVGELAQRIEALGGTTKMRALAPLLEAKRAQEE